MMFTPWSHLSVGARPNGSTGGCFDGPSFKVEQMPNFKSELTWRTKLRNFSGHSDGDLRLHAWNLLYSLSLVAI